jgi:hypothetical protein
MENLFFDDKKTKKKTKEFELDFFTNNKLSEEEENQINEQIILNLENIWISPKKDIINHNNISQTLDEHFLYLENEEKKKEKKTTLEKGLELIIIKGKELWEHASVALKDWSFLELIVGTQYIEYEKPNSENFIKNSISLPIEELRYYSYYLNIIQHLGNGTKEEFAEITHLSMYFFL